MIRSLLAILLIFNFQSLWANDDLTNQLKSFSKNVSSAGTINNTENCSSCEQSLSQTETIYSKHNKKSIELSVLSEKQALDIFKMLKINEDVPLIYPMDGCYARAHQMAMLIDDMGLVSGKAFIEGNLYADTKYGEVNWSYHVASLILVKKNNKAVPMVIDPGLFDKPVPYKTWKALLLKNPKAKLGSEYFTKRFNYDPETRHVDMKDYAEEDIENMKETNRSNRRSGEMLEFMNQGQKK